MARRVLVTGGAGVIGLEVCRCLADRGHAVHLFDLGEQVLRVRQAIHPGAKLFFGSILDVGSLRAAMQKCDTVIHLAAMLGVHRSESERLQCIEINVEGTRNVLSVAVQHRVHRIVFASSSEVYGEPLANPITEETVTQGKSVYAVSKLAGEELCKAYSQSYPIEHVILRYFNCYGPYQTAQFVIPKFIRNVLADKPPVVYGRGTQLRSYAYVTDTAEATVRAALCEGVAGQVLNIGSAGPPIHLFDLAKLVIRMAGKEKTLRPEVRRTFQDSDRSQSRDVSARYCSARKARRILGWKASVPLEEGLAQMIKNGTVFERWATVDDEGP